MYPNCRALHNLPVGETPTNGGCYELVSPPACDNLKYTQKSGKKSVA